jgi:hypothetical protein
VIVLFAVDGSVMCFSVSINVNTGAVFNRKTGSRVLIFTLGYDSLGCGCL